MGWRHEEEVYILLQGFRQTENLYISAPGGEKVVMSYNITFATLSRLTSAEK